MVNGIIINIGRWEIPIYLFSIWNTEEVNTDVWCNHGSNRNCFDYYREQLGIIVNK